MSGGVNRLRQQPLEIQEVLAHRRFCLIAVARTSQHEEGALRYELYEDSGQPGLFVFIEHWASEAAQSKHHNDGPHIRHFHDHGAANVERTEFFHRLDRLA